MADGTKIEWADATVNAINGCSVVSPGCTNCYAMRLAGTRLRNHPSRAGLTTPSKAGPVWNGTVRLSETALLQPLRWRAPRVIFWNAHGDTFHDAVPDDWIDRMFAVMALSPQHKHLVLTKRAERMRRYFNRAEGRRSHAVWRAMVSVVTNQTQGHILNSWYGGPTSDQWPLRNVWLGVSVEDQARAEERIPDLLATPAAGRFLSCEPMLGPIDLSEWLICPNARDGLSMDPSTGQYECCSRCDWTGLIGDIQGTIVGGESGPGARPMHPDWARWLRDQCAAAGVDFHFKQWGDWMLESLLPPVDPTAFHQKTWPTAIIEAGTAGPFRRIGKKAAGRLLDGVTHDALPWMR